MNIKETIKNHISEIILNLYQLKDISLEIQENKTDFEGDYTVVMFPLVKILKKSPDVIGMEIGAAVSEKDFVKNFQVVKGFLNLTLNQSFFFQNFENMVQNFGKSEPKNETVMVEYSSPNTNKPLHLGHIRNNLLGYSVAQILQENGYNVIKTQIINDRGIHICKSMLAWENSGKNETPESTGIKGDKLVFCHSSNNGLLSAYRNR